MNKKRIAWFHVVFWVILLIYNAAFAAGYIKPDSIRQFLKLICIEAGYETIAMFSFYFSYFFVAPSLFVSRKYIKAFLFFFITLAGTVGWRYILEMNFFKPIFGFDNYMGNKVHFYDFTRNALNYYFPRFIVYGLMYFFVINWYRTRHLQQELEKERVVAEVALLRSQINPHFLFNTINDIYSLAYQKSDQAPVALLKLSEILRYMLRDGGGELTVLKQEVIYLENLVELQRISAKGNVYINFDVEGFIGEQQVASLIFVSFVENAFKHGILNDEMHPVTICLEAGKGNIEFMVSNKKARHQTDKTGGIGLQNVRRRLELIYPNKHKLDIIDDEELFSVRL